jgi:hypothetical protein
MLKTCLQISLRNSDILFTDACTPTLLLLNLTATLHYVQPTTCHLASHLKQYRHLCMSPCQSALLTDPNCIPSKVSQPLVDDGTDLRITTDVTRFKSQHPISLHDATFLCPPSSGAALLSNGMHSRFAGLFCRLKDVPFAGASDIVSLSPRSTDKQRHPFHCCLDAHKQLGV